MTAAHLRAVRAQGCVIRTKAADRCFGPTEAHHVRTAANSGMGMKPPDSAAVGLCMLHHKALHTNGKRTFEARHGVDLAAEAARLALEYPDAEPATQPERITTMSDAPTLQHDQTLDVLRQRETDLTTDCRLHEIEGRILAGRLQELRDLIALCNRKPRTARKPRVTEGPQPIAVALEGALDRLGTAVRAQSDFDALGAGTASDTRAHDTDMAQAA